MSLSGLLREGAEVVIADLAEDPPGRRVRPTRKDRGTLAGTLGGHLIQLLHAGSAEAHRFASRRSPVRARLAPSSGG